MWAAIHAIGMDYRYGQDDGLGVTLTGPDGQYTFQAGTPLTVNSSLSTQHRHVL
jgi:hypothetical protein